MVTGFSYAALFAIMLFVGLGGRLLPTWMFLNSMQLIVHTPLVDTYMPTNLHIFIQKYLNLFRLNANSINDSLEEKDLEQGMDNYNLAMEDDSDYSVLLNYCGYKVRFSRNLVLILAFASFFVLLIAACTLFDCWKLHRSGSLKRSGRYNHASWMSNFTLRFFYMVFFEVFLCLMIHTLNRNDKNDFLWTLSLTFFVVSLAFIAFVSSLLCFGGPYIPKAFQEKSLLNSWWSVRPLNAMNEQTVGQQVTQQDNKNQDYLISQQEVIRNCQSAPSNDLNSDRHLIEMDQQQAVDDADNNLAEEDEEVNTPERSLVFNDERAFTNSIGRSTHNRQASSNFSQVFLPNTQQQRLYAPPSSSAYEGGESIMILQDNLSHGSTMMHQEACKRIELQDQVKVPLSYRTLFYGLKVNHEHNVGPMHLLTFILRRVLFSLIIVFGPTWDLKIIHSVMLLATTCLLMLLLLSVDGQWEESLINFQHTANEIIFYVLCCTLICFTGLVTDARQNVQIGYLCIMLIVTLIFYNLIVIVFDLLRFVMVLSKRYLHHSPKSLKLVLSNVENKFNKSKSKSKSKGKGKNKAKKTKLKQVEATTTKISSVQKLKAWFKSKFGKKAQVPNITITPEIDQVYEPGSFSSQQKSQTIKEKQSEQKAIGDVDEELLQQPQTTNKDNPESEFKVPYAKRTTRNQNFDYRSPHANNQFNDLEKYSGKRSGAGHVLVDLKTPKVNEDEIRQQTSHSSIPNTLSQMSLNNDIIAALDRIKIKAQNPQTAINALNNNKDRNQGHFKEFSQISQTQDANDNLQFAYADADQSPEYVHDSVNLPSEFKASSSDHIEEFTKQLAQDQKRAEASSRAQDPLNVLALTAKSTNKIKSFLDKQNRILSRTPKEKRSLKKLYEGSELSSKDKTQELSLEQQDQQIYDFNHSAIQDILGRSFKEFSDKFAGNQNYLQDSRDEVFINLNKKESKSKMQDLQDDPILHPQQHLTEVFERENYKFSSKPRTKEHTNIYDRIQSQPRRGILFKSSNTRTPAQISTLNPVSRDLTPDRPNFSLTTPHGAYTVPNNNKVQSAERDESLVNLQLNWHHVVAESRYTHRKSDQELNPAEDFNRGLGRGLGLKGRNKSEISIDSNSLGSDFKIVNLRNRREFGEGFNTGINVTRQMSRVNPVGGGAQSVGLKSGQIHLINKITKTNMMKTNKRSKSLVSNVSADKASRSNSIQRTGKQMIRDHILQQRINGDFYD